MNGGAISGNTATNNGGGVYVSKSGTFNMNGNAKRCVQTSGASAPPPACRPTAWTPKTRP